MGPFLSPWCLPFVPAIIFKLFPQGSGHPVLVSSRLSINPVPAFDAFAFVCPANSFRKLNNRIPKLDTLGSVQVVFPRRNWGFLIQAFLIVWLLISWSRRRTSEVVLDDTEHHRLGEVVSSAPGIVWETRIDPSTSELKATYVSDFVERMLGYTPNEWLSTPDFVLKIVHQLDRERITSEFKAIALHPEEKKLRFRCLTREGSTRWVEAHLVPKLDPNGKTVGFRGITLDVTEQQLSEEAHRRNEERNHALLEAIPDPMFLQTREGVYLDYQAKDPKTLGLPSEVFTGRNMRDVLPPDLAEAFLQRFKSAETGEPQVLEYDVKANGTHTWFEARIVQTGNNFLSVVRDVSARKLSEIALTQNEAQLAGIIGSALDAIITVDENQKIVVFNAAAESLFLCSAGDALGQSLDRFFPVRYRQAYRQDIQSFREKKLHQRAMELRGDLYALRASGEEFPIEASISHIELSGQSFYTIILRDITERKRGVDELRLSEERFAKSFRANPQPMSLTTITEGRYLDVNDSFLQMSGYAREEVIGHTSLELNIWETPAARTNFLNQLREFGSIENLILNSGRRMELCEFCSSAEQWRSAVSSACSSPRAISQNVWTPNKLCGERGTVSHSG